MKISVCVKVKLKALCMYTNSIDNSERCKMDLYSSQKPNNGAVYQLSP